MPEVIKAISCMMGMASCKEGGIIGSFAYKYSGQSASLSALTNIMVMTTGLISMYSRDLAVALLEVVSSSRYYH